MFTETEIKRLENIARVLGSATADLQELAKKANGQSPANRKRRNLKSERVARAKYLLEKTRK